MAPEQVRGEVVDARTDLFSLGIIIYELAAGRRPFSGATLADVSSAILRDAPQPLQILRADLPNDLHRIVGRCLEKDRERRFQTAKDVRNELELVKRTVESGGSSMSQTTKSAVHTSTPDVLSIAVLPFVNRSRDEEDEYFSDGLADELLNVLTKVRGLRVAARTSSYYFKGKNEDLAVIGQKLNVETLLEGSVRKAGNRVRIAVQLVKVSDGYHLWSETYDRTLDDIFALQDDIAQSVVKELRTTLMGEGPNSKASGEAQAVVEEAAKGRGENSEAYRLYLQGRYFVERFTPENIAKGITYLQQALELNPEFALAWAELGRALNFQAGYGWIPIAEGYEQARAAALRAIALEPDLDEGHIVNGHIQSSWDWDWRAADASYRRALEIAPNSAAALRAAGSLAVALGRFDQGLELCRRSSVQDPLSASAYTSLGGAYRFAGRLDEALAAYQKALELNPQRIVTRLLLAIVLVAQGRLEDALSHVEQEPEPFARWCGLAFVHGRAGRMTESDSALKQLIDGFSKDAGYQIAAVYTGRGETDAALEWLERSYSLRDPGLMWVKVEPVFRDLHGDPRWGAFLKKMKFAD
jgi:TolB-like protein/thioredoxin-like negative regulator of GroEL